MQYIAIKEVEKDGKKLYTINAIPLKNKANSIIQKIPHPLGDDVLEYQTCQEAQEAIERAGFSVIMPDGKKSSLAQTKTKTSQIHNINSDNFDKIVYETIKSKINSNNTSVVASAILALAEFPQKETFSILFEKLGEDNDLIRKNAILGICRHAKKIQNELLEHLNSSNWVTRNSALTCIKTIIETSEEGVENFIIPLVKSCEDSNPIVQSNAISVLALAYQKYKKI